jgi:hypothetical protein
MSDAERVPPSRTRRPWAFKHGTGRATIAVAAFVIVLLFCGAAYADNYTYQRTRADDALAGSTLLRKADFAKFGLTGGPIKPDETPNTDSCNGYTPTESDLVVTGDAESRFHDSARSIFVDSQVGVFRSTAMAATDVRRGQRMLSPSCQTQAAKLEHLKLVSYSLLGQPKCSCDAAFSAMLETKTAHANLDLLVIVTGIREGRFETTVVTTVGKSMNTAQSRDGALSTAFTVQALAVKTALARLHAT